MIQAGRGWLYLKLAQLGLGYSEQTPELVVTFLQDADVVNGMLTCKVCRFLQPLYPGAEHAPERAAVCQQGAPWREARRPRPVRSAPDHHHGCAHLQPLVMTTLDEEGVQKHIEG